MTATHSYSHAPLNDPSQEDDSVRKTKAAFTALVDVAASLLAERLSPAQVVAAMQKTVRESLKMELSESQGMALVNKARRLLTKRLQRTPETHRALALGLYEGIISNKRVPVRDRLAAQWAIVQMLGLSIEPQAADTPEDSARLAREFLASAVSTVSGSPPVPDGAIPVEPEDSDVDDTDS